MAEYVFKNKFLVSGFSKLAKSKNLNLHDIQPQAFGSQQRATSIQQREASNQQPATSNQYPATSNQQPATRIRRRATKLIMDFVDVDSDKWAQYARYTSFPKSWIYRLESRRLSVYERKVAEAFDHSVFVTQAEVDVFKAVNPHIQNVSAIQNGVDLDYFSPSHRLSSGSGNEQPATSVPEPEPSIQQPATSNQLRATSVLEPEASNQQPATRNQRPATSNQQPATSNQQPATSNQQPASSVLEPEAINQPLATSNQQPVSSNQAPILLFTGAMDYYANIDGVVWFTKEILPLIKKQSPGVKFLIVGSNPTLEIRELGEGDGVVVTGYVKDTREYLKRATVVVVPLRIARGIQNKILEAMAMGLPVVATPQAFEGAEASPGNDLILEEGAESFARATLDLINKADLRGRLGANGRKTIEQNYQWEKNLSRLDPILNA